MKEKIKFDCPYCQQPMKIELSNSTSGCHSLIEPYNSPEPWTYEVYYCRCANNHANVTFCVYEYYFPQISNHDEFQKACQEYKGPLTRHGYHPIGIDHQGFDGTVRIIWMTLGFDISEHFHASFYAYGGQTSWGSIPKIVIHNWENPYDEETIECPFEWMALSPDQIIDEMKKVL